MPIPDSATLNSNNKKYITPYGRGIEAFMRALKHDPLRRQTTAPDID